MTTQEILEAARGAKTAVALSDSGTRDSALLGMADALCAPESMDAILAANAEDMAAAKGRISDVMLDRLALTPQRIEAMAKGIRDVAALPDPVGRVLSRIERPNGLVIEKTAVPMGVIAIIYESRPNVTSDAAALAIKSGNACILRCGKEAWRSANAIVQALRQGLRAAGLPETAVCLIEDTTHASANALMTAVGYVDLLIPRGGAGGMTISLPQEDRSYMSRRELEEHIAVCLGGRVAEQLVLGDISTGASSDIQKASSIARNMVTKYGMSEKLGTIAYTSESNEVFIGRTMAQSRSYSEEVAGLIDEEVKSIVDTAYRRCEDILSRHRSQLELTAQYLLAHEVMSGETFQKVFTDPDDEVFEGLIPAES